MNRDIYLPAELVQTGAMQAIDQAGSWWRDDGFFRRLLFCEVVLTATILSPAAHAQSMQRIDLVGFVEARCSAVTPAGMANFEGGEDVVRRELTVRCSGQSPALSVRTNSPDDPEVTLTVASQHGVQTGERLSTREGNVVVGLADTRTFGRRATHARGPVEIIVAPAL